VSHFKERIKRAYWWMWTESTTWLQALLGAVPGKMGQALRAVGIPWMLRQCGKAPVFLPHVVFISPKHVSLGDRVSINRQTIIQGGGEITIGNDVLIGPSVLIWSTNHIFSDPDSLISQQGYAKAPVVIEDNVWIAAGAIILPGAHIGSGTVIAAGSVVRGRIPRNVVAAGIPAVVKCARVITQVDQPCVEVTHEA